VRNARTLHLQLLQPRLPTSEKSRLAREISGLIFTAEATALNITNRARILCLRIKTHAHITASGDLHAKPIESLWNEYRELESLLEDIC
jgi:hypothetical protein